MLSSCLPRRPRDVISWFVHPGDVELLPLVLHSLSKIPPLLSTYMALILAQAASLMLFNLYYNIVNFGPGKSNLTLFTGVLCSTSPGPPACYPSHCISLVRFCSWSYQASLHSRGLSTPNIVFFFVVNMLVVASDQPIMPLSCPGSIIWKHPSMFSCAAKASLWPFSQFLFKTPFLRWL